MSQRLPYVQPKGGSFYIRLVVPPALRPFVENGKGEILRALGNSLREVKANHARALASAQDELEAARQRKAQAEGVEVSRTSRRYAQMSDEQMARDLYRSRVAFDDELRNEPGYASGSIDDQLVGILRDIKAGRGTDDDITRALGSVLERFAARGNLGAPPMTNEWRQTARTLAFAEYEALSRVAERDEGNFSGRPEMPALLLDEPDPLPPITFADIIDEEVKRRTAGKDAAGVRERTIKDFRQHCASFAKHRKSEDATTVTAAEGEAWVQHTLSAGQWAAKTMATALVNVRTVLNWGKRHHRDRFPDLNPMRDIQKPRGFEIPPEERTYTMDEARSILSAARNEPSVTLHFVPWVTAYSGARISEIANLRREDFFKIGEDWFYKLTVMGDRTKKTTSSVRRVPVHPALVGYGLIEHVETIKPGERVFAGRAQILISGWINHKLKIKRVGLAPNHSWRHLFEDLCTLGGVSDDARSYMTGRSTRTSRDRYGRSEAALPGLAREMAKVPLILPK